jgi:hypothetical protein
MKQTIKILILLNCFLSFSQDWQQDKESLKGNVKYVEFNSTTYHDEDKRNWEIINERFFYSKNGYLLKSVNFFNNDSTDYFHSTLRTFNKEGNKCLEQYFILKGDTSLNCQLEYDSLARMTKGVVVKDGAYCSNCIYEENESGILRKCYVVINNGNDTIWDVFNFDSMQRLIREQHISSTFIRLKTWQYDSSNNLIEEKSEVLKAPPSIKYEMFNIDSIKSIQKLDPDPNDYRNYIITYAYDDDGQLIHRVEKFLDNRIKRDIQYFYKKNGALVIEKHSKAEFDTESTLKVVLELDKTGNWTKKIVYKNEKLFIEETRRIEYY